MLDFFLQDLDPTDFVVAEVRNQVDGVRTDILVDTRTCDVDTRRYVRLQMTEQELVLLILSTYEVNEAFIFLYLAIKSGWTAERTQEMVQAFLDQVTPWEATVVQRIVEEAL